MPHSHLHCVRRGRELTDRHARDGTDAADDQSFEPDNPLSEFPAEDPVATVGVSGGTLGLSVRRRAVTWVAFVSAAAKRLFKGASSRSAGLLRHLVDARRQAASVSAQWLRRMTLPIEQSLLTRRALALRACLPQRLPTGEPLQWATPISTFIGGVAVGAVLMLSLAPRPQGESSAATLGGTLSATRVSNPVGATPVPAGPEVVETARSTSRAPLATPRPATPRAARFQGSLTVTSHPAGAEVRVNGRLLGTTPLTLRNIPVGSRALQVKLGDHEVWSRAVQVVADRHTRVTATLTPASLDGSALR